MELSQDTKQKCPICHTLNAAESAECQKCGKILHTPESDSAASVAQRQDSTSSIRGTVLVLAAACFLAFLSGDPSNPTIAGSVLSVVTLAGAILSFYRRSPRFVTGIIVFDILIISFVFVLAIANQSSIGPVELAALILCCVGLIINPSRTAKERIKEEQGSAI